VDLKAALASSLPQHPTTITADTSTAGSRLNVTFGPGSDDTLQAFDDMCFSDILITGTSGLSHLVSQLCATPIILATPFWYSYEYIPNAIPLEVLKRVPYQWNQKDSTTTTAMLISEMRFDESRFDALWQARTG